MRNVFDQYSQPENQLTHALVSTLAEDRSLIRPFLLSMGITDVPRTSRIKLVEQQMPGEYVSCDEDESRGLPDAAFFDDQGTWCCLIESKVQASASRDQLDRHYRTAQRQGFARPQVVLLSVTEPKWALPSWAAFHGWREVYRWFGAQAGRARWARRLVQYMEVFEARSIERGYGIEGTITMFDGIRFDEENPYTYSQARRLLRLLRGELTGVRRLRDIGADLSAPGRPAITGRLGESVWDYIPLMDAAGTKSHTLYPHLTFGIHARGTVDATITIPSSTRGGVRTKFRQQGLGAFMELFDGIHGRMGPVYSRSAGGRSLVYAVQRHFRGRMSAATEDARLQADLRTLGRRRDGCVKHQPEWLAGLYELLVNKRSNIQFGVKGEYHTACPLVRGTGVTDLIADTWIAAAPLIDFVMGR